MPIIQLKPCPFCGTNPRVEQTLIYKQDKSITNPSMDVMDLYSITCARPGCIMFGSVPARYGNIDAAAKAWNARAEETPGQQACIKLKKAVALLESMRRNCINPEHYDDPMRMAKAEALRLAISSLKNDIG